MLDDSAIDLGWIDEMRHAKTATPFFLAVVDVNANDFVGAHHPCALNDVEPDAAKPEYDHVGARRDLGGVHHGADARCHAAADVETLVEWRVLANLGDGDLGQHGKVRESRATHIMENWFAVVAEARCSIGHQPFALGRADCGAKVGLAAQTSFALAAFRRVKRDDMIARLHRIDACSYLTDDP